MRFFVTGLCMQGNKGGPALALSLTDAIKREIPNASFVFSVPGAPEEWTHEFQWAQRYGFEICRVASLSGMIPPFCFFRGRLTRLREWRSQLARCDAMIQMSAICYVGPPSGPGTLRSVLFSPRWFDFLMTRLVRKPMLAWTQSYGPLSTRAVRYFARRDLSRQPLVFCRGDDCATAVKALLPNARTASFPDVAVTLDYDARWGLDYARKQLAIPGPFVTVSPSAVMYSRGKSASGKNQHIQLCVDLCRHLLDAGRRILLVPHTLRPSRPDPTVCDHAVALAVLDKVNCSNVSVVDEDLSPKELKSVIANAHYHVGARYHSVVAALSSGVPAISLSWHPKYRDLMATYGLAEFVSGEGMSDELISLLNRIELEQTHLRAEIAARHTDVVAAVRENARQFCALLTRGPS